MARPREFDEAEVLTEAMVVFWTRGYDATSITDLMDATGLAKGSLYKGFGDKKQLFMRALDAYLEHAQEVLREAVDGGASARDGLERFFRIAVEAATCRGVRRGCLSVNAAIELGPSDDAVRQRLRRDLRRKEKTLAGLVRRGIADGSFRADLDPEVAAGCITTIANGLQVKGKLGLTKQQASHTVAMALEAFV